jgi:uncharacterized membrane protein
VGIHAVSFAVPLILYAIWFLDEGRLLPFSLCAVVAATTKEEIAAAVGGLGIWYGFRHGRKLVGASICAIGLAVSLLNVAVVIPHFAPEGFEPFAGRYADVGGSPGGMLRTAFTDPSVFAHEMATWHKVFFLALVFGPFLGLWALEPVLLVGAVPDLVINLLSSKPEQTTIFYQYTAGIIPFVVCASVLGAARLRRRRLAALSLVGVFACLAVVSPLFYTASTVVSRPHAQVTATRQALKLIPRGVPVSASQTIGAYVSTRRSVATFPNIGDANWVIVGPIASSIDDPRTFYNTLHRLGTNPHWRIVFNSEGIVVLTRRA